MKKLDQKGFGHHLMIVGIAVLVVAAVGFAGFRVYQGRQIDAQAFRWTFIGSGSGTSVRACKSSQVNGTTYQLSLSNGSAVATIFSPNPGPGGVVVPRYSTVNRRVISNSFSSTAYINQIAVGQLRSSFVSWC